MKKIKKSEYIHLRITKGEKSKLKWLADMYAKGSVSKWILYSIFNIKRKFLK